MKKLAKISKEVKNQKGFTLLEVIVAISIVTIGLIGVLSLITFTISQTTFIKGELIASQLAQEAIEVVRNIRDNNWLEEEENWLEGLADGNYILVFSSTPADDWTLFSASEENKKVYYNPTDKFYGQKSGSPPTDWENTSFKRWIELNYNIGEERLEVTCHITWQERGNPHSFEVKDFLYDWQIAACACEFGWSAIPGSKTGTSYFTGQGVDGCTGTEMIIQDPETGLWQTPFREGNEITCINNATSWLTYHSKRESGTICQLVDETSGYFQEVKIP